MVIALVRFSLAGVESRDRKAEIGKGINKCSARQGLGDRAQVRHAVESMEELAIPIELDRIEPAAELGFIESLFFLVGRHLFAR